MLECYINAILYTTETSEKAKCCQIFDQFFDCLELRSLEVTQRKRNAFLKRYTNENNKNSPG